MARPKESAWLFRSARERASNERERETGWPLLVMIGHQKRVVANDSIAQFNSRNNSSSSGGSSSRRRRERALAVAKEDLLACSHGSGARSICRELLTRTSWATVRDNTLNSQSNRGGWWEGRRSKTRDSPAENDDHHPSTPPCGPVSFPLLGFSFSFLPLQWPIRRYTLSTQSA